MSTFNEPWTGGLLQEANFDAAPYRVPFFSEPFVGPPGPTPQTTTLAPISYPFEFGRTFPQQLPVSRIATETPLPVLMRQNQTFENGTGNGDNKVFMPQTPVGLVTDAPKFQGSNTSTAVHPNNDKAGATTAPNTTRPDMRGAPPPFTKLPNGAAIAQLQPGDQPQLWDMAPPPDPPIIPQTGTAMLAPTTPAWW